MPRVRIGRFLVPLFFFGYFFFGCTSVTPASNSGAPPSPTPQPSASPSAVSSPEALVPDPTPILSSPTPLATPVSSATAAASATKTPSPAPRQPEATPTPMPTPIPAPVHYACQDNFGKPDPEGFFIGAADTYGAEERDLLSTRLVIFWDQAEPAPNQWDQNYLSHMEYLLQQECALGRRVVLVVANSPGWVTAEGEQNYPPIGIDLPYTDPGNLWARRLRYLVYRFSYLAKDWTIWNEPDIQSPDTSYNVWNGTPHDMVTLIKVAYLTIKDLDPDAKIHLPGLTHWWNYNYFGDLLYLLRAEPEGEQFNYFFDYASLNLHGAVPAYREVVAWWRYSMKALGFPQPLWITEANLVAAPWFQITEEEQAAWAIQAPAVSAAMGAQSFIFFRWGVDPPLDFDGIFDIRSRKEADAVRTAASLFNGVTSARMRQEGNVWIVEMQRREEHMRVFWNMSSGGSVFYTVQGETGFTGSILNKYGVFQGNVGRSTTLTLPRATALQQNNVWVGGNPFIVVYSPVP